MIPNGVALPEARAARAAARAPGEPLRIAFVGQAVERKGLPVLLRAFEALRERVPAELHVVGVEPERAGAAAARRRAACTALGRVGDERKRARCSRPHVLCAPSLGGESFGMVLTEAFAAGTPVVASDIAGYRDVVDATAATACWSRAATRPRLAETLRDLALDPERATPGSAAAAARSAERYAWPRVAAEVAGVYEEARAVPAPAGAVAARRGARRRAARRRAAARRRPAPADARAAAAPAGAPGAARSPAARCSASPRSAPSAAAAGAGADRHAADRPGAAGLQPDVGAGRARR